MVAVGALVGSASAVIGARLLGLDGIWERVLSTKSVSSPFAITVNGALESAPELAAAVSVVTGVIGALLLPSLFRALRVEGDLAVGLATGQAAHVVGTEALARTRPAAVPYAALALALAGLMTALLLPPLWRWLA